ncbi:MAG: hypothetical protein U5K29_00535 [Acidimicrobiales bacterium]|nr:hypothetical protein [Acidimicrobiales bacterium]
MDLPERIVALHLALDGGAVPHAFGGALALAWCTHQARGTIDVDLNVFVPPSDLDKVLGALPREMTWTDDDITTIGRDGQVRLWWDRTPVDLFFNTTEFHGQVLDRVRLEPFLGHDLPFLACGDLAVFKAFFDRTRDWADLEDMAAAGTLDVPGVLGVLVHYLGVDDHRIERLRLLG